MRVMFALLLGWTIPTWAAASELCNAQCKIQTFIDQNIGVPIDRPMTLEFLRKFAPVLRETRTREGALTAGDTVHIFRYDGLTVTAEETNDHQLVLQRIDLSGGSYRMAYGIKLGRIERRDIDFYLGPPAETRHDPGKPLQWLYTNLEQTEVVTFDRADDAVLAVHWDFTPGD
ncbi:MAG: hypothetical protein GC190_06870 [Alphaproteobacteria bacterium]|nr:hypothetical protein [Alphaproteobacteria bacterium]